VVVERTYKATLSQSQEREGWSVIFRHPVLLDRASGNPGRRIRRGLGTRDKDEALQLVDHLNVLLEDTAYWETGARSLATARFGEKVADIFYHDLVPENSDPFALRDAFIQLPLSHNSEYRHVLFLGTTGGGKTTLVRQLIGTDPKSERFPSTSTAKTTVADTELLLTEGPFRAVVTFLPRDQVRDYVEECMSSAVLVAYHNQPDGEILRRLLNHVNQRFRLSYILGNGPQAPQLEDDIEEDEQPQERDLLPVEEFDLATTNNILKSSIARLRAVAKKHAEQLRSELQATDGDERVIEELFEDCLDLSLREDEDFQYIADGILDEIERRFDLLTVGDIERTKQGWPKLWRWESADREQFLQVVSRFSSNYARHFGRLLTPVVNGIRVAGPFQPRWCNSQPKLVLFDIEGLGHTPESSASLPTNVTRRIDDVDAVLLIDNATQPMQAAPVAAMRNLASSGKTTKLIVCFTHFDGVVGDNLPTFTMKEQHVLASAENALTSIGEQLGPFAERGLRKRLENGCFFLGGLDHELDSNRKAENRTILQLTKLLTAIDGIVERPEPVESKPRYDRMNLVLAIKKAAEDFHDEWRAVLGVESKPGVSKEHWTRIKALSRRFAEGWDDEYLHLTPVADLHKELKERIYVFIQNPVDWQGASPNDDEKQQVFDTFAEQVSKRILGMVAQRIRFQPVQEWQKAFNQSGRGSTFVRASVIADNIYAKAAPVPTVAPSPDRNKFLHDVIDAVIEAAAACGVALT
jgi:hypothetical protein